jgi:hypothetical protein
MTLHAGLHPGVDAAATAQRIRDRLRAVHAVDHATIDTEPVTGEGGGASPAAGCPGSGSGLSR